MAADDGTRLLATRFVPRGVEAGPVVLIRTPYGRDGAVWSRVLPRPLAARGHQVVVQSVRGTFGSGGEFRPGVDETADGLAAVAWVRAQPWCDGRVAMAGGSYLALTQWAVGPYLDEPLTAMTVSIGASSMLGGWFPQGALGFDQTLRWMSLLENQEKRWAAPAIVRGNRRVARAVRSGAVLEADVAAVGAVRTHYRERLGHVDDTGYWAGVADHSGARRHLTSSTSMLTGWHDLFLREQVADHQALVAAGRPSRITIGPWSHGSLGMLPHALRDTLEHLDRIHGDGPTPTRAPVRLFVQGLGEWRDHDSWPPPTAPRRVLLGRDGALVADDSEAGGSVTGAAVSATVDRTVRYDLADPTPAVGGPGLAAPAGPQDRRVVEARDDVLVHTGEVLAAPWEIVGVPRARIPATVHGASGLVVVRLCDVDPQGVSRNVTEGLARLRLGDTPSPDGVEIELDPTAHRFRAGHRLRVHVAAGAHPRVVDPAGQPYAVTVRYAPGRGPVLTLPSTDLGPAGS